MPYLKSMALTVFKLLAFNAQKWPWPLFNGSFGLSLGTSLSSTKPTFWSYLHLTLKNLGIMWPWSLPFLKNFMLGLSLGTSKPNLKSIALTVVEKLSTGLTDWSATHRRTHTHQMKTLSLPVLGCETAVLWQDQSQTSLSLGLGLVALVLVLVFVFLSTMLCPDKSLCDMIMLKYNKHLYFFVQ